MSGDEPVLIEAQRLLARALEVEQSCHEFYAREAEREEQHEQRAEQEGNEEGSV